jgi:uncharacterized repeat protein (TIGR04138 family)
MAQDPNLADKVYELMANDDRYSLEAYDFVRDALEYAAGDLGIRGHLTGQQLLEGIRKLAIHLYGPMAGAVLEHWGVTRTEDIGEIVFNMVEVGLLSKTASDTREDFQDVYDFEDVFHRDYPWHWREKSHGPSEVRCNVRSEEER